MLVLIIYYIYCKYLIKLSSFEEFFYRTKKNAVLGLLDFNNNSYDVELNYSKCWIYCYIYVLLFSCISSHVLLLSFFLNTLSFIICYAFYKFKSLIVFFFLFYFVFIFLVFILLSCYCSCFCIFLLKILLFFFLHIFTFFLAIFVIRAFCPLFHVDLSTRFFNILVNYIL